MRTCMKSSSRRLGAALGALLALAALLSLCLGSGGFGARGEAGFRILRYIRLPRVCAAMLSGAALACAGAILQGVLGNPLAGPNVIGVNAGAGFATLLCGSLLPTAAALVPLAAFAGALGAAFLILLLSRRVGASRLTVVLAGVAVSAILSAGTDLIATLSPEAALGLTAFRVGGFAGVSAARVRTAAFYIIPGVALALWFARDLDTLTLGDEVAASVGLNVRRARGVLLALSALLSGAAVSFSGLVGFVGLMVPHMLRGAVGGEHRRLLPLCALGGALLMLCADTVCRVAFSPFELPAGILLSLCGGPFFLWLVLGRGKRG